LLQGEYRIVFEKIYSCESTNVYQTKYVYLSKTTLNKTQMIGNVTLKKPFDNTLTVSIVLIKLVKYYSCIFIEIYGS